jgi:hypothetical protein
MLLKHCYRWREIEMAVRVYGDQFLESPEAEALAEKAFWLLLYPVQRMGWVDESVFPMITDVYYSELGEVMHDVKNDADFANGFSEVQKALYKCEKPVSYHQMIDLIRIHFPFHSYDIVEAAKKISAEYSEVHLAAAVYVLTRALKSGLITWADVKGP